MNDKFLPDDIDSEQKNNSKVNNVANLIELFSKGALKNKSICLKNPTYSNDEYLNTDNKSRINSRHNHQSILIHSSLKNQFKMNSNNIIKTNEENINSKMMLSKTFQDVHDDFEVIIEIMVKKRISESDFPFLIDDLKDKKVFEESIVRNFNLLAKLLELDLFSFSLVDSIIAKTFYFYLGQIAFDSYNNIKEENSKICLNNDIKINLIKNIDLCLNKIQLKFENESNNSDISSNNNTLFNAEKSKKNPINERKAFRHFSEDNSSKSKLIEKNLNEIKIINNSKYSVFSCFHSNSKSLDSTSSKRKEFDLENNKLKIEMNQHNKNAKKAINSLVKNLDLVLNKVITQITKRNDKMNINKSNVRIYL